MAAISSAVWPGRRLESYFIPRSYHPPPLCIDRTPFTAYQGLAVEGKCLRGSGRTDSKALQLLSAVSHRLRLTVAQEPLQEKSNEIPALKPLLQQLPKGALEGGLITADALHCQQESARFITQELGADYLFGLKGNQSGILERAQAKLPQVFFPPNTTPAGPKSMDG